MAEYTAPDWLEILRYNQLDSFELLWRLDPVRWFEPLNYRGGGWSGVFRHELQLPAGGSAGVFIKRQQNFFYRSWRNGFMPASLFEREFRNLQWFRRLGIPTLEPVYFGESRDEGHRAILMTCELADYQPLDAPVYNPIALQKRAWRQVLCDKVAAVIRHMHAERIQFNCLYPKHIFIRESDGLLDVRLIDLEKAKWRPFRRSIMVRDLGSLHRRASGWSQTDRLRFFLAYRQESRLSDASRVLLRLILRRAETRANQA